MTFTAQMLFFTVGIQGMTYRPTNRSSSTAEGTPPSAEEFVAEGKSAFETKDCYHYLRKLINIFSGAAGQQRH